MVDAYTKRRRKKAVTIHSAEAEYLAELPHDLTIEIGNLAVLRAQMRGETYMQRTDIDWAAEQMLSGRKANPWPNFATGFGGAVAGFGAPYIIDALTSKVTDINTFSLTVGIIAFVVGAAAASTGATAIIQRRA